MLLERSGLPEALLSLAHTNTPLQKVRVEIAGRQQAFWLKLEMHNPTGSIKFRTALALLDALHRARPLTTADVVIESSSGNLGVALADIADRGGWRFIAVVDPKTPPELRHRMVQNHAEIVMVDTHDVHGGYLLNRLKTIRGMLRADPALRWTDQYHNTAAAAVHQSYTAPELLRQTEGRVDTLFAAVSTGGTLAGVGDGLREQVPAVQVYAVDVAGSMAVGGTGHPHLLSGIGASRRSVLAGSSHYTDVIRVTDVEAIAMCRLFRQRTGLGLGASSGAVLAGLVRAVSDGLRPRLPVLISPDGEDRYLQTVYADEWLAERGVSAQVRAAEERAATDGMNFTLCEETS
ncbi:pyridoxal-phosphate dependent enzyme [Actinoplanes sp. NPDC051346]|uniref:pyridoxal-phosphate dependent enzyme n=1 Tax=Actinoplanes sp. NPDC051346 TaxID=3155048 RepID=UPI00342247F2